MTKLGARTNLVCVFDCYFFSCHHCVACYFADAQCSYLLKNLQILFINSANRIGSERT